MILAPDLTIAYINARAERLLRISRNLLVRGQPIQQVLAIPQLDEVITSTRYQQRPSAVSGINAVSPWRRLCCLDRMSGCSC